MINLGLGRIRALLARLDSPAAALHAFHVAGTNGKGSVCTYIESVLLRGRLRVGKFTSPHLLAPHDAIRVGGRALPRDEYERRAARVRAVSERHAIGATNFEVETAVAFEAFRDHAVDVAVVEVGLGGRDDATNVLAPANVLCAAVTKVDIDHEAFLGATHAAVAEHKAGIIKRGVPCVVDGSNCADVLAVVQNRAAYLGAPLIVTPLVTPPASVSMAASAASSAAGSAAEQPFVLQNQAVAREAVRCVYPDWPATVIDAGISDARWPGRLEWLDAHTLVDGAHNVSAATELRRYVDAVCGTARRVRWVTAFSKPADAILGTLVRPGDAVVATRFGPVAGMPWVAAQPVETVAQAARRLTRDVTTAADIGALEPFDGLTVVSGSLYLVASYLRARGSERTRTP